MGTPPSSSTVSNIARFSVANPNVPVFIPILNNTTNESGFNGTVNSITAQNNKLYIGGNFTYTVEYNGFLFNVSAASYLCIMSNPTSAPNNQTFSNNGSADNFFANGPVYAICSTATKVFVGGIFTTVYGQGYQYCACYTISSKTFTECGPTVWNEAVYNLAVSVSTPSYVIATGAFTSPANYGCYINATTTSNPTLPILTSPSLTTCNIIGLLDTLGGNDIISTAANQVNASFSAQTWTSLGLSIAIPSGTIPSGISYNSGTSFASYRNYNRVRYIV